jgi:serine/threonine protein kinase
MSKPSRRPIRRKRAPLPSADARDGKAWIDGKGFPLDTYVFENRIGKGANAVVFKAESTLLRRVEAVKIYLPREGDPRNKIEQGSFEAQKQAAAVFQFPNFRIINIYHAAVLDDRFYTTMEFFDGPNLKEWCKTASLKDKWRIAQVYNDAMHHTSREDLFHGDPHMGNILVGKEDIAILDYGTSHYSGREASWRRHWNIVDEVMIKLLREFESFEHYRAEWPSGVPGVMWAAYRDVLRALTTELFEKTDGTLDEVAPAVKAAWQLRL